MFGKQTEQKSAETHKLIYIHNTCLLMFLIQKTFVCVADLGKGFNSVFCLRRLGWIGLSHAGAYLCGYLLFVMWKIATKYGPYFNQSKQVIST